ncbi:aspartate/glutamate racemase family protein [Aspergillus tanneri]|uniref:Aspartate racemase n=1 Tax=Aspergillus tanneri TaxID=1220188 RepID=A0A5M9MLJ6_9EURO|nr:uncharacterized protein ATNIH1004_006564 [Aspergillus tanneri]KAA8647862.1 hypothetical protein ATNIH1004_006564 [Aspergillus tanneri]
MKTIGIIGGIGWPSTIAYYQAINKLTAKRLGGSGTHCAKLVLIQTDFHELEELVQESRWDKIGEIFIGLAERLQLAGAELFLLACNTFHMVAPQIQSHISLPMVHIVDTTARKVTEGGYRIVGLIGSRYTMNGDYFIGRLTSEYGLTVVVPDEGQQNEISGALHGQLVRGIFLPETRSLFRDAIACLVGRGAEVIILGCTEFGLIVQPGDSPVPIVDTTIAHAEASVEMAMAD